MLANHVSCHYVVTSVTFYHSALVDLTRSRSVHAVEHDPCCPDPTKLSASECKAVHYGLCSPLLKLPSFSIPPETTSNPASPATPKSTTSPLTPSTPNSPASIKGGGPSIAELLGTQNRSPATTIGSPILKRPASPVASVPASQSSPNVVQSKMTSQSAVVTTPSATNPSTMELGILDPVTLLANDLEDQLEALVNSFVAQDKVRLAARKKAETTTNAVKVSPAANRSVSPIKKIDKKSKDNKSSDDESESSISSETSQSPKANGLTKKGAKVAKLGKFPTESSVGDNQKLPTEIDQNRNIFPFDNQQIINPHSAFVHFEENMFDRAPSPSFKATVLPSLNPSPEYQQTGVKAQINKFTSKEKDALQNSPSNSLERRQISKTKPNNQEHFMSPTGPQRSGPLMLDALQQLLLTSSADPATQPIQTAIFESSKLQSVPYTGSSIINNVKSTDSQVFNKPDNYPVCYVNEACKELEEASLQFAKLDDIPSKNYHPQVMGNEYVQSAVDYAKTRFQNVQHTSGKLEDSKSRPVKNGHLVSDAKTKWENAPQQSWCDNQLVASESDGLISDPLRDALQRGGHKRTLSMEGLLDVTSPSIPHPKLTTAQKQHIKERSLSPTDRHSHVPIRPFLTKGSVAERVLLFECAPEKLERTTVGNKTKPNLISTWRPGGSDVQIKTQVSCLYILFLIRSYLYLCVFYLVVIEDFREKNATRNF